VGEVEGHDGAWVGVEWDDPSRGKHDGSTGGRRYFECAAAGAAGSFVRPKKLTPPLTVAEALRARYQAGSAAGGEGELVVATAQGRTRPIELVGMEKVGSQQGRLEALASASLADLPVAGAGGGSLADTAPALAELDLSGTLLASWEAVADVAGRLPSLVSLDLTRCRLGAPAGDLSGLSRLETLVLNATGAGLADAAELARSAARLAHLHLCGNGVASLPGDLGALRGVRTLSLDGNALSWEAVAPLGALPGLERLQLSGNRALSGVSAPPPGHFPALRALLLGHCAVDDWASVDALGAFPALAEARLSGNPLLERAPGGGRFEVIARVPGLTSLNGSSVRPSERRDAEIRYVRAVAAWAAAGGGRGDAEVAAAHPRFGHLRGVYGDALGAAAAQEAGAMGDSLVEIALTCVAGAKGAAMGTHRKRLPLQMSVGQLRAVCEKLFQVPAARMALFLRAPGAPFPEPVAETDTETLASAGVAGGWEVLVDEFDPEARRRAEREGLEERKRRLAELEEEQLRQGDHLNAVGRAALGM